jgi:HD-GYP domain-containing protein (c-di-GMP phosphodiesterase class II)
MKRVSIDRLTLGNRLDEPIYAETGKLLLAAGKDLTHDMLVSLLRGGADCVYVGEWDPRQVSDSGTDVPISDYRQAAERMADVLQSEVEKSLASENALNVEPEGDALEASMDDSLQTGRSEDRFSEWQAAHDDGVAFVESLTQGVLESDKVAQEAFKTVGTLVDTLTADISLLVNMTRLKSNTQYIYFHSLNVATLAISIATAMKFRRDQVMEVGVAALLHDLGMVMVPQEIINAPRRLTELELLDVHKHSLHVLYALERLPGLPWTARYIAYQNHERCDGSGYPARREKHLIHRFARIVAVADVYDALTSDRPWRKAYHPYNAVEHMIKEVPKNLLDGNSVRGLVKYLSLFPLGTLVRLNTGEVAKVVHSNGDAFDRPVVRVLYDAAGQRVSDFLTIDLLEEDQISIESFADGNLEVGLNVGF